MFIWIIPWQIFFLLFPSVVTRSTNETEEFSLGFFCVYCGRFDQTYSLSHSKSIIDCTQPYQIFCSSEEAIGCVKYLKIFDYHMEIIKDCLRLTDRLSCESEYSPSNLLTQEKAFCCNDRPFCNRSFLPTKKWLIILLDLFILFYRKHFFSIQ